MADIRVGVIGTGWVAEARHIPSYRRAAGAQVVAVCDRHIDRAHRLATKCGVPGAFSDVEEFLDSGLDIVSICTPPWTHAELACAALARGISVFTEKPMAMNQQEAEAMVAAATGDARLCVSHNFLFSRSVQKADRVLARSGRTVDYAFGVQMSSFRRRLPTWYADLPGGLMLDECPHMLYSLQHFLGPLEVDHARFGWDGGDPSSGHPSPEEPSPGERAEGSLGEPSTVELLVRGSHGRGQVTMLFGTPLSEWHIGVFTPERVVDLDLFRDIAMVTGSDRAHQPLDILRTSSKAVLDHASGFVASGARYAGRRLFWGHDTLIARFVEAVRTGGPSPVPTAESVAVVRLTDSILARLAADRQARLRS